MLQPVASSPLSLTEDDVSRLLRDHSGETIHEVSTRIAGGYTNGLKPAEAQAAEQIFRLLLRETETRIRASLADKLKACGTVPKDIILTMARDTEEAVALPVLQYTQALSDEDFAALIHVIPESHHLAIATREQLSEKLSDSLLEKGSEKVATALVGNGGAALSEQGMARIVETYPENKALISALVGRPGLPPTLAERMVSLVSDSLARTLRQKYGLPEQEVAQQVEKTREDETLTILRTTTDIQEMNQLVAQLKAGGRLTASLVVSSLCQGNILFLETALAKLADVSPTNARALINDRGELGFRAIYNKSGLPSAMFPAVKLLLRVVQDLAAEGVTPKTPYYSNRVAERVLACGEKNPVENLSYIIALIRRGAGK